MTMFPHATNCHISLQSPLAYVENPKALCATKGYLMAISTNPPVNRTARLEGNMRNCIGGEM
jgi:hypothetical protein